MNLDQLVRPNIQALKPYSSARSEFKGQAEIFLDANENPFETGLNRYPDPLQKELKGMISTLKKVSTDEIFLGNGSDEVIDLLIRIFCEPKEDYIIIMPPTYGMYRVPADIANVKVLEIPLTIQNQINVEAVSRAIDVHAKLLFVCHPNNPTGNNMTISDIEKVIKVFPGIVVVDEAYIDFSDLNSTIGLLNDYDNLVVMQTFSKAWGLAGIRLGMAFTNKAIIHYFNKVKPPYNINLLTQKAAIEALNEKEKKEKWVSQILAQRDWLNQALKSFDFVINVRPTHTNFILVEVIDPLALYHFLINQKVIVRDRSKVLNCEGCLRITVGTPDENRVLLKALTDYEKTKAINS